MIWTHDLLTLLNHGQRVGCYPPVRCPHIDLEHERYAVRHQLRTGLLEATSEGWICPVCHHWQNFARTERA